jgi:tight adherence protein C
VVFVDFRLLIAICAALGACLITAGIMRFTRRQRMRSRLRTLAVERSEPGVFGPGAANVTARDLAGRLGAQLSRQLPGEAGLLAARVERAGLSGGETTLELLGWKAVCVVAGGAVGVWGVAEYGAPGLIMLVLGLLIGWFGIDIMLARFHQQRRRAILRDLPTMMDLLVLSLEAGMGLDRALRTVIQEYHSRLSDEVQRVLTDMELGVSRGAAFQRMAERVDLEDLHALSRAIIQSEELGVSLVGVMQTQSREVRLSRRREAEAEALRAPIKMLIPLVVFILPTLFLLLLGPVGLRAGAAISGAGGAP